MEMDLNEIELRAFGKTGRKVTCVGLGGEGILRTHGNMEKAREVILEAVTGGITYFDSALVYADSELYYGSVWSEMPKIREGIFQASKSPSRSRDEALLDLDRTLKRLQTDYLDLWQIHDVRTENDLIAITAQGGALDAFLEAKSEGRAGLIGVTGHHDPEILKKAVEELPVDSVMLPVNPAEGALAGFLTSTLPAARKKGIAVIGMKILGAARFIQPQLEITPELLIRYALSRDIDVAIVGCSSKTEVETLIDVGAHFQTPGEKEMSHIDSVFAPVAQKAAFYRPVS